MKTNVRGKTVLMVPRREDPYQLALSSATTTCRECKATCSIAPASIERIRAEPEIVVLCVECSMEAHAIEPFASFAPVSMEELAEAMRKHGKR